MKLILQLNEARIDLVKKYAEEGFLPNWKELIENKNLITTKSEEKI